MTETCRVLVVSDDADTLDLWTASLELAGYDTDTCLGPGGVRDCPRLHGARCIAREGAEVAVVDLDCDEDVVVCAKMPDDGGTVFVRRSMTSPSGRGAVLQAVEDAKRHVEDLHDAVVRDRLTPALDVD